ncbi:TPA: hypothetical protein I9Z77_001165 [Clostridium perfringens]|nr:hypothetical protein [Clostridium perfringens]
MKKFYINYEECKFLMGKEKMRWLNCFILTMRNVNCVFAWDEVQNEFVLY